MPCYAAQSVRKYFSECSPHLMDDCFFDPGCSLESAERISTQVTHRANRKKRLTVLYIVEHPNQEGDTCIDWTSQHCWTNGWNCLWRGHSVYRNRPLIPSTWGQHGVNMVSTSPGFPLLGPGVYWLTVYACIYVTPSGVRRGPFSPSYSPSDHIHRGRWRNAGARAQEKSGMCSRLWSRPIPLPSHQSFLDDVRIAPRPPFCARCCTQFGLSG